MNENPTPENDITSELRQLGKNIIETLQAAWESEERKKVQREIEDGLDELARSFNEASTFDSNKLGQDIKASVDDLTDRFKSGEVETRVREDLLNTLKAINTELTDISTNWTAAAEEEPSETKSEGDEVEN